MNNKFKLTAVGILIMVIVGFAIGSLLFYTYVRNTRNAALHREMGLIATYKANQTELSSYASTFQEQVGVVGAKGDKMSQLIQDSIRYGDEGFKGGTLAAAITEASQDLRGLDIYDKIMDTITAGREGFRNKQNMLIDKAREYDTWRKEGLLRPWILSGFYPSRELKVTAGGQTYYAEEALDKLSQPILTASTNKAFETGIMEPMTVPAR